MSGRSTSAARVAIGAAVGVLVGALGLVGAFPATAGAQEPAAATAAPPVAAGPSASAPAEPSGLALEGEPIDEEARAEQRTAGFLGLSGWTVLGIVGGLWLALRWRRTRRR